MFWSGVVMVIVGMIMVWLSGDDVQISLCNGSVVDDDVMMVV